MRQMLHRSMMCALIALLLGLAVQAQPPAADEQAAFVDEIARRTYSYLASDWATSHHLPWSWRSETINGGDYANTTEIALLLLAHLGAYDLQRSWSPDWETVDTEINGVLDLLLAWQTGAQTSQPNGANAHQNSVFYQWYWISWDPPVVGASDGDHLVPSIDNAFLAASLITLRAYGEVHGHTDIAQKAEQILSAMDFRLWYDDQRHLFKLGGSRTPFAGVWADYYSNENRIINFVARALGQLSAEEYQRSLDALAQPGATYNRANRDASDDIRVEKVAWDGSYFTYMAPGLFIREVDTPYFEHTVIPVTEAQIAYAAVQGYAAWGLSDTFDIGDGGYIGQGAPPTAMVGSPETRRGVVAPHVSGMALVTPYREEAILNLQAIAGLAPEIFHSQYGFYDSVMADPSSTRYGERSARFTAIAQGWLFASLVNAEAGTIWEYFYQDSGVQQAHAEMFGD